jgi:mannosyltransferase OCH1-like enzyme
VFPRILHQTWKTRDLSGIEEFALCAESWRKHHPGYEYRLWDDRDNARFVRDRFEEYFPTWASFDNNITRLDSIRYMWMYVYGGIYADLDMECLRSLDELAKRNQEYDIILFCDLDSNGTCISANPALIISKPGSSFWLEILDHARVHKDAYVTHCTGPYALGRVANRCRKRFKIQCLDQNRLFIRKTKKDFYTKISGNERDHLIYQNVYCATEKPDKYFEDKKRKYVADWHGTPKRFRWHREYKQKRMGRTRLGQLLFRRRS